MTHKIRNLEVVIPQLKSFLRKYLEEHGTVWRGGLFTCPNHEEHSNGDQTPSCGFVPETDETICHCFACQKTMDIFNAYNLLEHKPIHGQGFNEAVIELATKYGVVCELKELTPEEQKVVNVRDFLTNLLDTAHRNLLDNKPEMCWNYLKDRGWDGCVEPFGLGFLPDTIKCRESLSRAFEEMPYLKDFIVFEPFSIVDRLIFPVKDPYGHLLGFSDRSVSQDDYRPRYQHHFMKHLEKGEVLYNLPALHQEVFMVEGMSSVLTLFKHGIKNVVAIMGTDFSENKYKNLVKSGVKKVVVCPDCDEPGISSMEKTIKFFEHHPDIIPYVKILPIPENKEYKNVDDYVNLYGIEKFKEVPSMSVFRYQLDNFLDTTDEIKQEEYKHSMFEILSHAKDTIIANKMIDMLCKDMNLPKKIIIEEMKKYNLRKSGANKIDVAALIVEENALLDNIETFEERSLRSQRLLGMSTGFPVLDSKIDGMQSGLVLVSGKWNTGKSAYLTTLALNFLENPTNYVVYFSIDDGVINTTIPRFVANLSRVQINSVKNPVYKIEKNETMDTQMKEIMKGRRNSGIEKLKSYSGRLGIKDCMDASDVNSIEKMIETYRVIAGDRNMFVFVDFLNLVNPLKVMETTAQESMLASFFKRMSTKFNCPVICTVETTKGAVTDESEGMIKGSSRLQFASDLTLLLWSDYGVDPKSKMYFHDENGKPNPVVRVKLSKNKMDGWKDSIYYKFYNFESRVEEFTESEQIEFTQKLD